MPIDEDEHGTYIMNSKDLRAIEHLNALWSAGVESFKNRRSYKNQFITCH